MSFWRIFGTILAAALLMFVISVLVFGLAWWMTSGLGSPAWLVIPLGFLLLIFLIALAIWWTLRRLGDA